MPPRFAYWTILAGGLPTAFRAAERDELMPTFQRLREKHPDAEMKWFARGKLWNSPDEARNRPLDRPAGASNEGGFRQRQRPPAAGDARGKSPKDREPAPAAAREARGRDWRPGGGHRDPRQKYADAKKARNADHRKRRFERKHGDTTTRPGSASEQDRPPRKDAWHDRPPAGAKSGGPPFPDRRGAPKADWRDRERPRGDAGARPAFSGGQDRPPRKDSWRARPPAGPKSGGASFPDRDGAPKADWRDRDRPRGDAGARPAFSGGQDRPPRKDAWRDRPPAGPKGGGASFPDRGGAPKADWRDRDRPRGDAGARPAFSGGQDRPPRKEAWRDRPPAGPKGGGASFPDRGGAPKADWRDRERPRGDAGARPAFRGGQDRPPRKDSWRARPPAGPKSGGASFPDRDGAPKADWRDRDRPRGDAGARPAFSGGQDRPPRKDAWRDRPPAGPKGGGASFPDRGGAPKADWRDRDRPRGDAASRPAFSGEQRDRGDEGKGRAKRPFVRGGFGRQQGTDEPSPPERPRTPNREPHPRENPEPPPPPRPSEPTIMPPGPPERGRRKGSYRR